MPTPPSQPPEARQPRATRPGGVRPGGIRPGGIQHGAHQPEEIRADLHEPEQTQPEQTQPGVIQPGAIQAEQTQPGVIQAGAIQAEQTQPAVIQPGAIQQGESSREMCPRVGERPLPDPALMQLFAVPDSAPPYDDASTGWPPPADLAAGTSQSGGHEHFSGRGHTGAADQEPWKQGSGQDAAAAGQPGGRPAWPGQFAQVLVETLAGSRPPRQMVPWTTQRARANIQRLAPKLTAGQLAVRQRPLVRRVVTSQPCGDVVEMTVVVGFGPRIRALAVRLERTAPRAAAPGQAARPSRWLCTAVEAA